MKHMKQFGALFLSLALALALAVPTFAAVEDTGFSDVDANAWYAEAVIYCREHNLMAGIGNHQFAPESNLTRVQLAAVLHRIEGTPVVTGTDAFTDTPDGTWYSDAVLWASQQGLVSGYGGGLFGPNDPVTREQMTAIFWRYAGSPTSDGATDYNDEAAIASYAAAAVDWASINSIVAPISAGVFAPKSHATRAHVAAAPMNYSRRQTTSTEPDPDPDEETKVLIAYFSATNTTEGIANHLDAILNADLYKIVLETPYTSADLNYNTDCRANREQNDASARPAISGSVSNMEQYDVIFLGYPDWWSTCSMAVFTFLDGYDFTGKIVISFCANAKKITQAKTMTPPK